MATPHPDRAGACTAAAAEPNRPSSVSRFASASSASRTDDVTCQSAGSTSAALTCVPPTSSTGIISGSPTSRAVFCAERLGGVLSLTQLVLPQQPAADDRLLDLRRALADEQEWRLAHQPLDFVLLGVAVTAVDAERLLGDL